MTTYSQRYAAGDSNTAGAFYFDTITAVDYAATKIGYGAAGSVTWVDASNPLPVSVIAALPAGTNAIGKLAANSGVDIGDVDVTSIIPGTGATNLGKAIDTATGATDTGVLLLATRDDALSAITPVDGDNAQLRVDANGALWVVVSGTASVSDGGGSLTVDGTVNVSDGGGSLTVDGTVSATQNGTWTVTANQGGAWNVDTVSTVTAVTTVSTVTNVATIGTSVTPGTGAGNLGKAEDAAHNHSDTGVFVLAVRRDVADAGAGTDGDYASLNVDSTGRLWCNVSNTLTVASHAVTNAGTFAVQVDGSALTALQLIDDIVFSDDAAFTPGTSKVAAIGCQADESSTDSVDEGDIGCPRMTLDRKQIVTDLPHTAGGLTPHKTVSAASTNATSVKGSAGQLYEIMASNVNAAARYLKLYDKATAPTVGTDTPVWTLIIPGNTAGGGICKTIPKGLAFANGIAFALTTEATDAGTTAVAANELVVNLGYK